MAKTDRLLGFFPGFRIHVLSSMSFYCFDPSFVVLPKIGGEGNPKGQEVQRENSSPMSEGGGNRHIQLNKLLFSDPFGSTSYDTVIMPITPLDTCFKKTEFHPLFYCVPFLFSGLRGPLFVDFPLYFCVCDQSKLNVTRSHIFPYAFFPTKQLT